MCVWRHAPDCRVPGPLAETKMAIDNDRSTFLMLRQATQRVAGVFWVPMDD